MPKIRFISFIFIIRILSNQDLNACQDPNGFYQNLHDNLGPMALRCIGSMPLEKQLKGIETMSTLLNGQGFDLSHVPCMFAKIGELEKLRDYATEYLNRYKDIYNNLRKEAILSDTKKLIRQKIRHMETLIELIESNPLEATFLSFLSEKGKSREDIDINTQTEIDLAMCVSKEITKQIKLEHAARNLINCYYLKKAQSGPDID